MIFKIFFKIVETILVMLSLILLIIDRPSTLSKQSGNVWKRQKIAINPEYKNLPRKRHPTRSFLRFFLKDKLLNEMSVVYSFSQTIADMQH